jgi:hypothetical protein
MMGVTATPMADKVLMRLVRNVLVDHRGSTPREEIEKEVGRVEAAISLALLREEKFAVRHGNRSYSPTLEGIGIEFDSGNVTSSHD